MSRRAWAQFVVLSAVWGASYLFIKIGLRDMSAAEIVCVRTALAAAVLWPLALQRRAIRGLLRRAPEIALLGTIQMAAPFMLITLGERHIASSLAGILVAAAPIWIALIAPVLDPEESSSGWKLAGIVVGIVGVGLLLGVDLGGDSQAVLGGAMVVIAALGYALAGLFIKRRFRDADPVGLVAGTTLTAAILTLPAAIATAPSGAPGAGAARRRDRPRRGRHRHGVRARQPADRNGGSGQDVARGVRVPGVRAGLRRGVPERGSERGHVRRPGAHPLRLVAGGRRAPTRPRAPRAGHTPRRCRGRV